MQNSNDFEVPREWQEELPPSDSPEKEWYHGYFVDEDQDPDSQESAPPAPTSLSQRFGALSPRRQMGYGCLAILVLSALLVYCVGGATVFVRPMLAERAVVTPTSIVRPTLVPTPTQEVRPTFIQLPPGKLLATPTQAPIPSREPPTVTPTTMIVNGMTVTPSPSPTSKPSATRNPTLAPTTRP